MEFCILLKKGFVVTVWHAYARTPTTHAYIDNSEPTNMDCKHIVNIVTNLSRMHINCMSIKYLLAKYQPQKVENEKQNKMDSGSRVVH